MNWRANCDPRTQAHPVVLLDARIMARWSPEPSHRFPTCPVMIVSGVPSRLRGGERNRFCARLKARKFSGHCT